MEFWPLFFLLTILEAAVALIVLLRIPSEGGGLSAMRWILILPLLLTFTGSALTLYLFWRNPELRERWLNPASKPGLYRSLTLIFPLLATVASLGAFLLRWWDPDQSLPFFERAWPLLEFIIIFSIQTTLWLLILRFGVRLVNFSASKPALITFTILLIVFGFVNLTNLGTIPDPAYWGEPGVAIQGWQMGLALITSSALLPLSLRHSTGKSSLFNSNPRRTDIIISVLLWMLAAGIWLSVPSEVLKNSFYFPIDPPTDMPLPYSDSGYYDYMAHSLLIGTDYSGEIPTRPLYIVFLTILHALFGENYHLIIIGQTLVLALFPVIFYLLGKQLHSRLAGVTIALLAIFREWTSLLVSSDTRVSNTKILLVDIPTLLLILLACLFAVHWLEQKDKRSAFIAGGIFGILLLLRTQSMLILPILFLIAIISLRSNKYPWLGLLLLFFFGLFVSVAPWLTHNYLQIGKFAFDAPFQYQVLASQYAYTGNLDYGAIDLEGKSLSQILITFAIKDPGFVIGFITNHFLATEVGALLALPLLAPFNGLRAPVNLYWTAFDGTLTWQNSLLLIGYLGIIAIGIGASWKRLRWIGLLPLAFNLGYALANGVGRFSGWRYNLPADWIAYFYFGIGFAEILLWLAIVFGFHFTKRDSTQINGKPVTKQHVVVRLVPLTVVFLSIGALPWIVKITNPAPRYQSLEAANIQETVSSLQSVQAVGISPVVIQDFSRQPQAIALAGRLLYPRYFGRNDGISSSTPWPSYTPRDFPRLGFLLLNQKLYEVVLPIRGVEIGNIQGEDTLILGCIRDRYIEARVLALPNADLVYVSELEFTPCSP